MVRRRGLSVRWKLTFSYAGFLIVTGGFLFGVVWLFLLRYVPDTLIRAANVFVPNRYDLMNAFIPAASITFTLLLILGVTGGWLLAGRMLSPLTKITEATRDAAKGSLSHRINLPGRSDEFRELADAFDTMMERIEKQVLEQQRFAANASHELRTPLAITQTVLEVAQQRPHPDHVEDLARLWKVNSRAIALTESLLMLSRAGASLDKRDVTDLSLVAEEAVETLIPFAEKAGITITTDCNTALVMGEPVLLTQLATNLVHNAIMHNLPDGGTIDIRTGMVADRCVLIVENSGAHLSPLQVATFTEPFQRGSERTRYTHGPAENGVGLGLAIVARIVESHNGQLDLAPREHGGLRIYVALPSAEGNAVSNNRRSQTHG
ncbi:sensor histidine kinase [Jonesia quinghaiensis]|uniref:sensor histidine kinase n=1 Tax=Jonesia quinghaiensis TaxID=262806 RepID=UPI00040503D9|nr:HAMP domain-containing sensor histidine kinase [Jonesia quinghaiensis]